MSSPYPSFRQRRLYPAPSSPGPMRSPRCFRGEPPCSTVPRSALHSTSSREPEKKTTGYFIHTYIDDDDETGVLVPAKKVHFDVIEKPETSGPSNRPLSTPASPGRSDIDDSDPEVDDKIPKPPGPVGRPGRNGYNLRVALQWQDERHEKVKAFINKLVDSKLDCTISFSKQVKEKLDVVRQQAATKFPILAEYRGQWATDDFIRCRLKSRRVALQKAELERQVGETRIIS
ncbi:hypothetical protein DFJ43DRAFT_1043913 [Lentinula guzmanii]|uniref:Uncharacterized protein n=1 Tax=Lentinula guzmanii TaxID=2804957 RepID=A0AA38JDJ1_9AGAR|nr:hypothetical protein DFJ43DRAFT_1043913 [Lentinula guzmanii]